MPIRSNISEYISRQSLGKLCPRIALACILVSTIGCSCASENRDDAGSSPPNNNFSSAHTLDGTANANKKVVLVPRPGQVIIEGGGAVHIIGKSAETQAGARQLADNLVEGSNPQLALPALTCVLEDCSGQGESGQPFLFYRKDHGVGLNESGNLISFADAGGEFIEKPGEVVPCPACGRSEGVRPFVPPAVTARKEELIEELRLSRAAARARREGQVVVGSHRRPREIMEEMAELPRVYLAEEK